MSDNLLNWNLSPPETEKVPFTQGIFENMQLQIAAYCRPIKLSYMMKNTILT